LAKYFKKSSSSNPVSQFVREERDYYLSQFGPVSFGILFKLPYILAFIAILAVADTGYYLKSGNLKYFTWLLPCSLFYLYAYFGKQWSARKIMLKNYIAIILYLSHLYYNFTIADVVTMDNNRFLFSLMIGIFLCNFLAFLPYLLVTFAVNTLILVIYLAGVYPIATARGINIIPSASQALILGLVMSSVMTLTVRYKIFSMFQSKLLAQKSGIIKKSSEQLTKIFSTLNQAIFSISLDDETVIINQEKRSPYCSKILDLPDDGVVYDFDEKFLCNLEMSEDEKNLFRESIKAALLQTSAFYPASSSNFPQRAWFQHGSKPRRYLLLTFAPVTDNKDNVTSILISVIDNTASYFEKIKTEGISSRIQHMINLVSLGKEKSCQGHAFIENLYRESLKSLHKARTSIDDTAKAKKALADMWIPLHTIKGNARTLGFQGIASASHEVENSLEFLRKEDLTHLDEGAHLKLKLEEIDSRMQKLENMILSIKDEIRVLRWDQDYEVTLEKRIFRMALQYESWHSIRKAVESGQSEAEHLEKFLTPGYVRASRLSQVALDAVHLPARMLKKPIPDVRYEGDECWILSDFFEGLAALIPHLAANSIDHGIEAPEIRETQGKSRKGTITIECKLRSDGATLSTYDDGGGLNLGHIAALALKKGMRSAPELAVMTPLQKAQLIMENGFSSASEISELSGRGAGLDAVKIHIEKMGGTLSLRLGNEVRPQQWTLSLEIFLPSHAIWN
jgi:HPt (histidine-containing phosphotransfer) domain-containing protein